MRIAELIYGPDPIALDDPAETYHEASKNYRSFGARLAEGVRRLDSSPDLRASSLRSVLRHEGLARVPLSPPVLPELSLASALTMRASCRTFKSDALSEAQLSALLHGCYGVTRQAGERRYRAVPSGGALFPLEVYVLARAVSGLPEGVYHFDPHEHSLEVIDQSSLVALEEALLDAELARQAPLAVVISCMFWRSRFKYGLRAYRFSLLEAGHAMQNLLLIAQGLGLGAVPLGGFFDARIDELIGADGVEHSALYVACVGAVADTSQGVTPPGKGSGREERGL